MSGSIDAAGQVAAINNASKITPIDNPLQVFSGWQDYANKVATNAQIKAATANMQQQHAANSRIEGAKIAYGLSSLPDQVLAGGGPVFQAIDAEVAAGGLNAREAAALKSQLPPPTQADGTQTPGAAYRPYINAHLIGTLGGTEAISAITGRQVTIDNGSQFSGGMQGGALGPNPGAITPSGPAYLKLPGPENMHLGDRVMPTSGGMQVAPTLNIGTSPEQANQLETIPDPNNPGQTIIARNAQLGGLIGSGGSGGTGTSYPPGTTVNGGGPVNNGQRVSPDNQPRLNQTSGKNGAGLLSNGPASVSKPAVENATDTYNEWKTVRAAQPQLKTTEQTLMRMNDELRNTATGPITDVVQTLRNYVSSLNQLTGGKIGANDIAAANRDELAKDINQLASQSGAGAISGGVFDVIAHGNPNMAMNTLANLNVTSILIGQNRQKQLEYLATRDKNTGADLQQVRAQIKSLDPRALAIGTFTPEYQKKIVQEIQKNPRAYNNFYRSINLGNKYHLFDSDALPGAGKSTAAAQMPATANPLQAAPSGGALNGQ